MMCTPTQDVWQPAGCVSCELVCVCVSLVRVVIICLASTHTALVSSPSLTVLHLPTSGTLASCSCYLQLDAAISWRCGLGRWSVLLRICSRPECTDRPCYVNTRPRSIVRRPQTSRISVSCPSQVAPEGATNVLRITNLSSASTFGRSGCASQGALRPTYYAHAFRIRVRSGGRRGLRLTHYAYA